MLSNIGLMNLCRSKTTSRGASTQVRRILRISLVKQSSKRRAVNLQGLCPGLVSPLSDATRLLRLLSVLDPLLRIPMRLSPTKPGLRLWLHSQLLCMPGHPLKGSEAFHGSRRSHRPVLLCRPRAFLMKILDQGEALWECRRELQARRWATSVTIDENLSRL